MKHFLLLLIVGFSYLTPLAAQTTDPELAEKLKAVMSLVDKHLKFLEDENAELNRSNTALTEANLKLFKDLQLAEKRIGALESENLLLRRKLSETAVREFESAALTPRLLEKNMGNRTDQVAVPEPVKSASGRFLEEADSPLIDINTASPEELTTLPLIDAVMAEQIISNRPYKSVEDLLINQGFGPMKLRRLSPLVTAGKNTITELHPADRAP